jgi:hypothetical protein
MQDNFFTCKSASFAALATRNLTDALGWNFDLPLRLWIKAQTRLSLLFRMLAEPIKTNSSFFFMSLLGRRAGQLFNLNDFTGVATLPALPPANRAVPGYRRLFLATPARYVADAISPRVLYL